MASRATDIRERVEVAEGAESPTPAEAATEARPLAVSADPAANVFMRLWRVEQELGAVEKAQVATVKMEGGGQYTYKYSGHDMILAHVRPLLHKHGVKVWPTTKEHSRVGNLTVLTVVVEFVNVDTPADRTSIEMVNYGADKGDKGASKALTNAMREAIKKALNISSQEDERADETTEFNSNDGASREDLDAANERTRAAIEKWAVSFKAALKNAKDIKGVQALERENRDQLMDAALPEVTRTFFVDLIQERKAALTPKDLA